jgi:hypothetical protein
MVEDVGDLVGGVDETGVVEGVQPVQLLKPIRRGSGGRELHRDHAVAARPHGVDGEHHFGLLIPGLVGMG